MNYSQLVFLILASSLPLVFSKTKEQEEQDNIYKVFNMDKSSFSKERLRKEMKKINLKYHPDKNKDKNASQILYRYKEYHDILNDDQKRSIYDNHGYEAAKNGQPGFGGHGGGHGGFGGFEDIFEKFFGGGGRHQQQQYRQVRRTPDVQVRIQITLEDAFKGAVHHFQLPRTKLCNVCKGVGAENPKDVHNCDSCNGTGMKMYYRHIGPGMVQQVRSACEKCGGKGKTYKSECSHCHGKKMEKITETLEIKIDPGVADATTIKYSGKADEAPGHDTGDLYVTLGIESHPRFRRDGNNLYTKISISLKEALLGVDKYIMHLDGRTVPIKRKGTIQPNQVDLVSNEGMPINGSTKNRGNLFVEFEVHLPITISKDLKLALEKLPGDSEKKEL